MARSKASKSHHNASGLVWDYPVDRYSERKERQPERLSAIATDIGFVKR